MANCAVKLKQLRLSLVVRSLSGGKPPDQYRGSETAQLRNTLNYAINGAGDMPIGAKQTGRCSTQQRDTSPEQRIRFAPSESFTGESNCE